MKNQILPRPHSPLIYFLSSLVLLLGLALSAQAQMPPGWLGGNIGTATGGETCSAGTFAVTGSGTGLAVGSQPTDQGHFTYQQVTGDIEIVARVASFDSAGMGQVAMCVRAGLGTSDQSGACIFWPGYINGPNPPTNYMWLTNRGPTVDGNTKYFKSSAGRAKPTVTLPFWFKLVRIGNNFGTYWSFDGRDWFLLSNQSGGVFSLTGTYDVGFFVSSNSASLSTATFDNVYVGPPRLKYKTSWVGNTSGGIADGNASNQIYSLWVKPSDGTCYANGNWDESGMASKVYKDGKVFHGFFNGGNTLANEGCVTGNGSNIFFAANGTPPAIYRTDFSTNAASTPLTFSAPTLGVVGGLAASATRIFVSDVTNGLVRIVDATTLAEITPAIPFPHCGPIACDGTNFWITQCASDFPISWHVTASYTPAIKCYTPAGADTGRAITDTAIPTALAYDDRNTPGTTSDDRLWVCDNGPNQNVRYYTNLTGPGNPVFAGTFGQTGGIWSGSHPGQITDAAAGGDKRFYGPTGVGVDSGGNIYVACNGGSFFVTDLRKFNSAGTLLWRQNGLVFVHVGDFDPTSDGQQMYSPEKHFTMNYANTAPGSEWSYTGFTRNITLNANEGRNPAAPLHTSVCRTQLQRLGAGNLLYMYTGAQGMAGVSWLYYFNGETAVPFGTNTMDTVAPQDQHLWIDLNLNGIQDAGEVMTAPIPTGSPGGFVYFDVDSGGDIWMDFGGAFTTASSAKIRRVICNGTQTLGTGGPVVPSYSLAAGGYVDFAIPALIQCAVSINYDRANDVLYILGVKMDATTWVLMRCDKWLANPANVYNPVPTWVVTLPPQATDLTILYQSGQFDYCGFDVVGGKIFIAELYGPVHVYDAALGNPEITLNPGPECSARIGWEDMSMGLNAFKRANGEYLITEEDAGIGANDILYRWTPQADTVVAAAPTQLTATAPGRKVVLNWAGSYGMITSYNLYRSTSSGTETLYQSGIASPTYVDTNVLPGVTYYYKVSVVNAAGESVLSNEASVTPLSTQAEFVKFDTTTQGTWKTVYGNDGYEICNNATSYPAYATVSAPGTTLGSWASTTSDVRGLQKAATGSTDRIAAYRTSSTGSPITTGPVTWDIAFTDGKWHQVAIYQLDWDIKRPNHRVDVIDTATGTVLDTRAVGDFSQGKYLVWNVYGNVQIKVYQPQWRAFTVASGIFFDPVPTPTPALGWWKLNETGGAQAADSSPLNQTATCAGHTWDAAGKINGCLNLLGPSQSSWLNQPTNAFHPIADRTFATWIKTATSGPILGSQATPPGAPPTQYAPILYVGDDGKLYGSYINNTLTAPMVSTATVTDNAWHHVALVRSGAFQVLYLDGNVVGNLVATIPLGYGYNWMGVAYVNGWPHISGAPGYYTGRFDDVRYYNRALGPGEIWAISHP